MLSYLIPFPWLAAESGIISYEMKHIQNGDGIWRFISFVIIAITWYNPLAYYLLKENIRVSEMLCDEVAVGTMTKEEKTKYMECILEAVEERKAKIFIMTLGTGKRLSAERMERIMGKNKKKTWRRGITVMLVGLCFLISSIPVLAYDAPMETQALDKEAMDSNLGDGDMLMFIPAEEDIIPFMPEGEEAMYDFWHMSFDQGDEIFTNEKGEVCPIANQGIGEQNQMKAVCAHNYVSGTATKHNKSGDGSCTVEVYNAQRCTRCGAVLYGSLVSTTNYNVCPH